MTGRFWEICRGVNCDLGTSAAFRAQWDREAARRPADCGMAVWPITLRTDQEAGDAVAMTAAIYSLHTAYPDKYVTSVESRWPEVFAHNPYVTQPVQGAKPLHMHYPAIHACNDRGIHFMQGWCEHLGAALGVPVPLLTNRPRLYFADPEPSVEDYWVVCSGGKRDFTNKLWGGYQEVVDRLRGLVMFVQVGRAEDNHSELDGVDSVVGETTLRQLFNLVRRARGVLCGVSLLMHVAAALEKPAVVIAGGREPVQWNAYSKQQYVHTVGALPCRDTQGHVGLACWRSRVVPMGDGTVFDRDTCERPVDGVPQCMRMITPDHVAELVLRYNSTAEADNCHFPQSRVTHIRKESAEV